MRAFTRFAFPASRFEREALEESGGEPSGADERSVDAAAHAR
jgi:hypothetical protein